MTQLLGIVSSPTRSLHSRLCAASLCLVGSSSVPPELSEAFYGARSIYTPNFSANWIDYTHTAPNNKRLLSEREPTKRAVQFLLVEVYVSFLPLQWRKEWKWRQLRPFVIRKDLK